MTWQYAHPPATLEKLYTEDPRLSHLAIDFVPQLTRLLEELMVGICGREEAA
jgi:hypothetical protein